MDSCHATECGDLFAVLYLLCLVLHINGMFDGDISLVPSLLSLVVGWQEGSIACFVKNMCKPFYHLQDNPFVALLVLGTEICI